MLDMPYFMENEKWYRFDFDKRMYALTNEAPKKAQESYAQYQKDCENMRKLQRGQR